MDSPRRTRRTTTRAALLLVSAAFVAMLALPAGASALHFSAGGTFSDCNNAPSTACTITVQNQLGYTASGSTITITLAAPYTYAQAPSIGANNCGQSATVSLITPTNIRVSLGGAAPPCTFTLVEQLSSTGSPTSLPCQTFDLTDGSNSPPYTTCAVADTLAPVAPSIASTPASPSLDPAPRVRGTAEPFSTVKLYETGNCSGAPITTGTAVDYNSPGFLVSVPAETTRTFSVTATDGSNNTSLCSAALTYINDSIPPDPPTVDSTAPTSPANDPTINVKGTAEAGSTVRLYDTPTCTGIPVATGTAAVYSGAGLALTVPSDGTRQYRATATDAANNVSGCSSTSVTYTLDTGIPVRPVITGSSPASPADANKPELKGTAEAGSTIRVYLTANCSGPVAVSGSAADFTSDGITVLVPTDATSQLTVTSTDAAGNVSPCSVAFSYTEDSTTPNAPGLTAFSPAPPSSSNTPRARGTAEAGSTVRIYTTSNCSGPSEAAGSAAAFSSPGLLVSVGSDTTTTFYASTTDAAGHTSPCSGGLAYTEDSTNPAAPTITATDPVSPANDNTVDVLGSAEAGSTVRIHTNADCSGASVQSGTSGAFATPGLSVGVANDSTTALRATATDAAGNVSACSAAVTYVEDSTPPAAPEITDSTPDSPADDNSPLLKGSAAPGSTVRIYTDSTCTATIAVTGSAATFADPGLAVSASGDDVTTYYATARDAAGNTSACSSGFSYTEDSTTPDAPALTGTTPDSPSTDDSPRVKGTAESGSTVNLYTTEDCTGTAAATGSAAGFGDPGLSVTVPSDETTTFYGTTTDAAGHTSPCSSGLAFVEDSTQPAAPTITATDPVSPANDNTVDVLGSAEAGSTVRIYTNADCSGASVQSGTAGAFATPGLSVTVAGDSTTQFRATVTDGAGNVSDCSDAFSYEEDSTPEAAPSFTGSTPGSPADDNSPLLKGTAAAGSTVAIYTDSDCTGTAEVTGSAATFADPGLAVSAPGDVETTYYAAVTDAAGNTSACSEGFSYTEDSTEPDAPTLTGTTPGSPSNDNSPKVEGTAETGSTVDLYTTADCTGTPAATGTEDAFTGPGLTVTVASDETTTFYATATDAAGNTSACAATGVSYEEDSTAPVAPTFSGTTPSSPSSDNTPRIKGDADAGSTVSLYESADCSGTPVATGTAAAFADPGLTVTVASDSITAFSSSSTDAAGNTTCSASTVTYIEDSTVPDAPQIGGFTPGSPANDNSPKVKGTAEADGTVTLYTSADCTGAVAASGTTAAFASPGLAITVADNSTTQISATTTDVVGNVSACSAAAGYVEDSAAPAAPTLGSTSPASPANDNQPEIKGGAEDGSTVRIYATADCTGPVVASGSATALTAPGLTVTVADDSVNAFSAIATDAAGNASACSAAFGYKESSTPAAVPFRDRIAPTSTIAKLSRAHRLSRKVTLKGTASGTGSALQVVRVSVARLAGKQCRFLRPDGTFTKKRSCARTTYLTATGGTKWSLKLRKLPKGSYKVRSRAIDAAGNIERKSADRNLLRFRL